MSSPSRWAALQANLENLGKVAAGLAGFVGVLYVVGAVVIGVRLGLRDLPSTAVVAQLPREFLLSTGLNVVLPAPAAAVGIYVSFVLLFKRSTATNWDGMPPFSPRLSQSRPPGTTSRRHHSQPRSAPQPGAQPPLATSSARRGTVSISANSATTRAGAESPQCQWPASDRC